MKKVFGIILILSFLISSFTINVFAASPSIGITYQGYIQSKGWQGWFSDGNTLGTAGQTLKLEALKIKLINQSAKAKIKYQAHIQNVGWQTSVYNGTQAGLAGKGLQIEAIKISLENLPGYSVQYQAYVHNEGWKPWVCDGQVAGTEGKSLKIDAIRIKIVQTVHTSSITLNKTNTTLSIGSTDTLKATIAPSNATNKAIDWKTSNNNIATIDASGKITAISAGTTTITATTVDGSKTATCTVKVTNPTADGISVSYQGYIQSKGWQNSVTDGALSGTVGQSLRMEALKINLIDAPAGARIKYQAHVKNIGWQSPVYNGNVAGTLGKGLQIEAIKISLENMPEYSVEYKVQCQNIGWQSWVKNGEIAGTVGRSLRVEAIKIRIIKNVHVQYQTHVENIGWQSPVSDGTITGTNGQYLRVEALNIKLINAPNGASLKYQVHIENIGWQDWKTQGENAGTVGQSLRTEAIKIQLINAPGYSIQYQADIENLGWQPWVQDGQAAGTTGLKLRIKGIRIRVISNPDKINTPPITPPSISKINSIKYRLISYLNLKANRESVGSAAIALNGGVVHNTCVYFSSESLRRIGVNVPIWMCNTKNYVPYLMSLGWKKQYNKDVLSPGDICFTIPDGAGNPTHTFVFADWVNPDDHTLAYVIDNQKENTIHIRNMLGSFDEDAYSFFLYK